MNQDVISGHIFFYKNFLLPPSPLHSWICGENTLYILYKNSFISVFSFHLMLKMHVDVSAPLQAYICFLRTLIYFY